MHLNISITAGEDRDGGPLWTVGVEDEETGTLLALIPAATEEHAELAAEQIGALLLGLFAGHGVHVMPPPGTG